MNKVNMYGVTTYGKDADSAAFSRAANGTWLMYYGNCSVQLDPGSFLAALLEDRAALDDELRGCRAEIVALKAQVAAAKPKRRNTANMGEAGVVFADIRAAFVEADGSICRTVNGAILQPGTALYVLGDLIE